MSSDSFQLLGMAERGFLPAALAKRSRHDTPILGVILSSLGILTLVTFNFTQVVSPPMTVMSLCILLQAVIQVKWMAEPHLQECMGEDDR